MPVDFSIKQVPDEIAERLRERAQRNHRSLQGELRAVLEAAASEPVGAARSDVAGAVAGLRSGVRPRLLTASSRHGRSRR